MTKLLKLEYTDVPKLPRHAKLRYDEARKKWIINAPERVFELDETASEIMRLLDGNLTINSIIDELLKKFKEAPREAVTKDVLEMLQSLADKGFVVV
jgi:pyrroloquinoline quinone biosynthesis protein D